ncbi:hypothetical protein GBA52_024269 [Prunus armeniaca]|nr:hypothetical protein GBA52_024269 [Prunus armeniaca]
MDTIKELNLIAKKDTLSTQHKCDVQHNVLAVFFSMAGYTGNVYHEFNDGILPLYITSRHLSKRGNKSIFDFRDLLNRAYIPRIQSLIHEEELQKSQQKSSLKIRMPKLVVISRNGSRAITNENLIVKMAEQIGFQLSLLELLGQQWNIMVHLQKKLGLKYIGYQILATESSLYDKYDKNDPILADPTRVNQKGWEHTKKIYLEDRTVRLDLKRFRKQLVGAYDYIIDGMCQD